MDRVPFFLSNVVKCLFYRMQFVTVKEARPSSCSNLACLRLMFFLQRHPLSRHPGSLPRGRHYGRRARRLSVTSSMEREPAENEALLRYGGDEEAAGFAGPTRAVRRLRRADLACLAVMGIVASFLLVWQPPERPMGSLTRNYRSHRQEAAAPTYQYVTYDDIDAEKRKSGYEVTYTKRGFTVDGKTTLLLGGSIHYSRSTPAMWEDLLRKAKNDGLNHIELYVFWSLHEPTPETFHFSDRANLTLFYDLAAEVGLFLNVRFGPYACAEWNNGGLPFWLDRIPGMTVRSSAEPWKKEMSRFVKKMVEISRPYFATSGGPIIMAQIENEYDEEDDAYVAWCGDLVRELDTKIPWMMCNGKAANNTILTCNANDCVDFANTQTKERPTEPLMWTENEGWYQQWQHRPRVAPAADDILTENWEDRDPEEISYAIARWFAVGGSHHNYYMYHGGNNYGRSPSAGVATKYADGVNLHSDGLSNEPKRSHLRKLHNTLIECNEILLSNERQIEHPQPLDTPLQLAYVYGAAGNRVVFLQNDAASPAQVVFDGITYQLQPKSVSIVKNNELLFDTAAVRKSYPHRQKRVYSDLIPSSALKWHIWTESGDHRKAVVDKKPLEQLSVTQDETDYMIYTTTFKLNDEYEKDKDVILNFTATDANGFVVLVDGRLVGEAHRAYPGDERAQPFTLKLPSWLREDSSKEHELSLVSVGLGLFTLGRKHLKGITGDVTLNGQQSLIGHSLWKMYPGLIGEHLKIYDPTWNASVPWTPYSVYNSTRPTLSWYRTSFSLATPPKIKRAKPVEETTSILLDAVGLTRGRLYLNGHDLGRHWLIKDGNGEYVQRYYHIPPDWLHKDQRDRNDLVIFDEMGGSVKDVRIVLSSMIEDFMDPEKEIRAMGPGHSFSQGDADLATTDRRGV